MKDLYSDVQTICDFIDDLAEKAHKGGENVECLRDAQRIVWNWYSSKHCPQLMYESTEELIREVS